VSVTSVFTEPVDGGFVTFTPPATGASVVLSGNPAQIVSGLAQVNAAANDTLGAYQVQVAAAGAPVGVNFSLSNSPGAFSKSSPSNGAFGQEVNLSLSWEASTGAASYNYCIDTTNDNNCDGDAWQSAGNSLSVDLSPLTPGITYYWQVRAVNGSLVSTANGGAWWHFTVKQAIWVYLPVVLK